MEIPRNILQIYLPNDLTSAPRSFTKIMKLVLSTLRKLGYNIISYLGDRFVSRDTFAECTLPEKCVYSEFYCSVFSHIWTEYGAVFSPNTGKYRREKLRRRTFFMQ